MAGNKKPRKAYRPRAINRTIGIDVLERRTPMDKAQTTDLGIAYHVALDEMLKGRGTEEHWSTVVCALNISLVLAERGYGSELVETVKKALAGAVRVRDRARKCGRWGFDGDAMNDVRAVIALHDEQMRVVTKAVVLSALSEVHRRIDAGNAFREAA
ncbi:Fis family transcriptional regulator [Caballeronia pedi]|uniref:Fis family transcriptional regulator n=1 Tax=Caballeronia pedi TaxID=1777141 RepID=A0A158B6X5_9BURK|nr:hypothetical protein [Caballeronia pedi]SAK65660.1 Fis family transcriptional regulator [Caballeronia pedi]